MEWLLLKLHFLWGCPWISLFRRSANRSPLLGWIVIIMLMMCLEEGKSVWAAHEARRPLSPTEFSVWTHFKGRERTLVILCKQWKSSFCVWKVHFNPALLLLSGSARPLFHGCSPPFHPLALSLLCLSFCPFYVPVPGTTCNVSVFREDM